MTPRGEFYLLMSQVHFKEARHVVGWAILYIWGPAGGYHHFVTTTTTLHTHMEVVLLCECARVEKVATLLRQMDSCVRACAGKAVSVVFKG